MKRISILLAIIFALLSITLPVAGTAPDASLSSAIPSEYLLEKEDEACEKYISLLEEWSSDGTVNETTALYPSFYGGVYIDDAKNLVIQVTDVTDEIIAYFGDIIDLDNVIFNEVDYSYSTLQDQYNIILNDVILPKTIPSVNGISIVAKDNSVNIYVSEDNSTSIMPYSTESIDDFIMIDNVNIINDSVISSCSSVEPGSKLNMANSTSYRSVGFWAIDSNGNYGIITAPHGTLSVGQQMTINGSTFGTTTKKVFSGTVDVAFVQRTNSSFTPTRSITGVSYSINGYTTATPEGATVITVGATTGVQIGTVLSSSTSATYHDQTITDLLLTSTQVAGGDSGGIVLKLSSDSKLYISGIMVAKRRTISSSDDPDAGANDPGQCIACKFTNIQNALGISMY